MENNEPDNRGLAILNKLEEELGRDPSIQHVELFAKTINNLDITCTKIEDALSKHIRGDSFDDTPVESWDDIVRAKQLFSQYIELVKNDPDEINGSNITDIIKLIINLQTQRQEIVDTVIPKASSECIQHTTDSITDCMVKDLKNPTDLGDPKVIEYLKTTFESGLIGDINDALYDHKNNPEITIDFEECKAQVAKAAVDCLQNPTNTQLQQKLYKLVNQFYNILLPRTEFLVNESAKINTDLTETYHKSEIIKSIIDDIAKPILEIKQSINNDFIGSMNIQTDIQNTTLDKPSPSPTLLSEIYDEKKVIGAVKYAFYTSRQDVEEFTTQLINIAFHDVLIDLDKLAKTAQQESIGPLQSRKALWRKIGNLFGSRDH
jgi:uncharacterized UPF0146 family protein